MTYLSQIYAILWKDLLLELRTRERIAAMGAFAVLAGVLFNFSMDQTVVRAQDIAAGLIWMTLVFGGLLGIGRTFHLEAQDAIFLGKTIANFVLLYIVAILVVAVFTLFFGLDLGRHPGTLALALALGALGFVALGTLFSAVSTGTNMGETLLPILVFPLLVPMVIFGVSATGRLLAGRPLVEVEGNLRMLAAFAVLAVGAGATMFRFVVEE